MTMHCKNKLVTLVADKVERQCMVMRVCFWLYWRLEGSCPVHVTTTIHWKPSRGYIKNMKVSYCNFEVHLWLLHRGCEGCQCIVVVIWTGQLHLMQVALCNKSSISKQTSYSLCLFSLSATMVSTLWLKQQTCFCSVMLPWHCRRTAAGLIMVHTGAPPIIYK